MSFLADQSFMAHADLSEYTIEEIELAKELHDDPEKGCSKNCPYGPYAGWIDAYGWLEMARRELSDRPQKEVLF